MALTEAGRFFNSLEAGMAKARLEAEDIPSIIFGLEMSPVFAGGIFNIQLMVDEDDLDQAREILSRAGEEEAG
jgi:hypothetical protein